MKSVRAVPPEELDALMTRFLETRGYAPGARPWREVPATGEDPDDDGDEDHRARARSLYRPDQARDERMRFEDEGKGSEEPGYRRPGDKDADTDRESPGRAGAVSQRSRENVAWQAKSLKKIDATTHADPEAARAAIGHLLAVQTQHEDVFTASPENTDDTQRMYKPGGEIVPGKTSSAPNTYKGGNYTDERLDLHEAQIGKYMDGKIPVGGPLDVVVMGGGPAAGKSTMLNSGAVDQGDLRMRVHVDPDELKGDQPEYPALAGVKDPRAGSFAHEESSDVSKELARRALTGGFNATIDGTGDSGVEKQVRKVAEYRAQAGPGARIRGAYATLDVEKAVDLMYRRAAESGRMVPEAYLREVHADIARQLPQMMDMDIYDEVTLYDTDIKDVARPIATKERGVPLVIHDQALWDKFLARGTVTDYTPRGPRKTGASARLRGTAMAPDPTRISDHEILASMIAEIVNGVTPARSRFAVDGVLPPPYQEAWDRMAEDVRRVQDLGYTVQIPNAIF